MTSITTTINSLPRILDDAEQSHCKNIKELSAYIELKKFICNALDYDIKTFILLDVREDKRYYKIIFKSKKSMTFCRINKMTRFINFY